MARSKAAILSDLLEELFMTGRDLQLWLLEETETQRLARSLPEGVGIRQVAFEAARRLVAWGLADEGFFRRLEGYPQANPQRLHELIVRVRTVEQSVRGDAPPPSSIGLYQQRESQQRLLDAASEASGEEAITHTEAVFRSLLEEDVPFLGAVAVLRAEAEQARAKAELGDIKGLRKSLLSLQGEAQAAARAEPEPFAPLALLATLDLARLAASQLRYAESRAHLHEALDAMDPMARATRVRLAPSLRITLIELLDPDEPPPSLRIPMLEFLATDDSIKDELRTWAREHVPPP